MGLLDALFGGGRPSKVEVVDDFIWLTKQAKFAGLVQEAMERAKSDTVAILLVAHFPDVLERLQSIADERTWDVPCRTVSASELNLDLAKGFEVPESACIDVIVGERHPLPSVDDRLKDFAQGLQCRCRFSHHVSLDDDVMRVFAGDWVKGTLQKMGMGDDEAIQSKMVSRRIRKAQETIEGRVPTNHEAQSAGEWLEKNCPAALKK